MDLLPPAILAEQKRLDLPPWALAWWEVADFYFTGGGKSESARALAAKYVALEERIVAAFESHRRTATPPAP